MDIQNIYPQYDSTIHTLSQAFCVSEDGIRDAIMRSYCFDTQDNDDRIRKVFCKAARGEAITVAGLGGSITQGVAAKRYANGRGNNATEYNDALGGEKCWFERTADWFRQRFPQTQVSEINAGIGATPSFLGTFRLEQMVLQRKPDLVTVEFSVNDPSTFDYLLDGEIFEAYESIIRKCLDAGIAVIQIFLNDRDNNGLQRFHSKIAEHYHIPVSPDGQLICDWVRLSPDEIHPNNAGHALLAACLCNYLDHVYADTDITQTYSDTTIPGEWLYSDTFYKVYAQYAYEFTDCADSSFVFRTDMPDCKKWNGTLVSTDSVGNIRLTVPKGAKRVWIQYFNAKGSFETDMGSQRSVCNTAPLGWPKALWHRVYTGAPLQTEMPLCITSHKKGDVIIIGLLVSF